MEEKQGTAPDPSEPNTRTDRLYSLASRWFLYIAAGFLVYVLSIGPAAKLSHACKLPAKHPHIQAVIEAIYSPILIVGDNCPPVGQFLNWYVITIWRVHY
jgi:hypothetical protein